MLVVRAWARMLTPAGAAITRRTLSVELHRLEASLCSVRLPLRAKTFQIDAVMAAHTNGRNSRLRAGVTCIGGRADLEK